MPVYRENHRYYQMTAQTIINKNFVGKAGVYRRQPTLGLSPLATMPSVHASSEARRRERTELSVGKTVMFFDN